MVTLRRAGPGLVLVPTWHFAVSTALAADHDDFVQLFHDWCSGK